MLSSKKCLSAIVALVLLLFVSFGAYFTLQNWYDEFSSSFKVNYRVNSENEMQRTSIQGLEGDNLYFKNTLDLDLILLDIKIDNISCSISKELPKGFSSINLSSCYDKVDIGVNEVVVFTNQGVFSKTYHLGSSILGESTTAESLSQQIYFVNPTPIDNLITTGRDHTFNVSINLAEIENITFNFNGISQNIGTQESFLKVLNLSSQDTITSVVKANDGFYVTGRTNNFSSEYHTFLSKYDFDANQQFLSYIPETFYAQGENLILTKDGNITTVAMTSGPVINDNDLQISKFDPNGNEIWTNYMGGNKFDRIYNVVETFDNGFIATGGTSFESYSVGSWDHSISKFDSNGNWVWSTRIGGADEDFASQAVELSNNDLLVTGYSRNYGDEINDNGLIVRLNSAGTVQWAKHLNNGVGTHAGISGIVELDNGNFTIFGSIRNTTSYAPFIAEIDENANLEWFKILDFGSDYSLSEYEGFKKIFKTQDGNYLFCGLTTGFGGIDKDILYAKVNSTNGEIIWAKYIDGSNNDEANGIIEIPDGSIIIAGISNSFQNTGPFILKVDKNGNLNNFDQIYDVSANPISKSYSFDLVAVNSGSFTPINGLASKTSTITSPGENFEVKNSLELKGIYPNQYFEVNKSLGIGTSVYSAEVCDISTCYQTETRSITANREDYITNSILFDGIDDYLYRSPLATNSTTFTIAWSFKDTLSSTVNHAIFGSGSDSNNWMKFRKMHSGNGDGFRFDVRHNLGSSVQYSVLDFTLKDPSDHYSFVLSVDTTNPVASERLKFWANGKNYSFNSFPSLNSNMYWNGNHLNLVGASTENGIIGVDLSHSYFSNFYSIDGQALDALHFGEYNNYGKWVPKQYSGTYGTNGFYLNFNDSSNLGKDYSGNNNDWTVNGNPTQTIDTPENNFAVLNSLFADAQDDTIDVLEGNLLADHISGGNWDSITSTLFPSSGKWYFEVNATDPITDSGDYHLQYGVVAKEFPGSVGWGKSGHLTIGFANLGWAIQWTDSSNLGKIHNNFYNASLPSTNINPGDIIQIAYDLDNGFIWFGVNNVWIEGNPELGTGASYSNLSGSVGPALSLYNGPSAKVNFGATHFKYTPPTGFKSISSKNLESPTVIPSQGFDVLTYTGTGGNKIDYVSGILFNFWPTRPTALYDGITSQTSSQASYDNSGPSWVDVDLGREVIVEEFRFYPTTDRGFTDNSVIGISVYGFDNDSFVDGTKYDSITVSDTTSPISITHEPANLSSRYYRISMQSSTAAIWLSEIEIYDSQGDKITGLDFSPSLVWIKNRDQTDSHKLFDILRGTTNYIESDTSENQTTDSNSLTSFNSDGFTLGTGSNGMNDLNEEFVAWNWKKGAEFGFDIVNYTGNDSIREISHNLGREPEMMIFRGLNNNYNWLVYNKYMDDINSANYGMQLDTTIAKASNIIMFNDTMPTSSAFTVGTTWSVNQDNHKYIAYLFTSIEGFSKIGSYSGNGAVDGPFIYTGFKPKYVMIKNTDLSGEHWWIMDSNRNTGSNQPILQANSNGVENSAGIFGDFISNGFKVKSISGGANGNGYNYIYIAFADYPMSTNY